MELGTLFLYTFVMITVILSYKLSWKKYNWFAIVLLTLIIGLRGLDNDTMGYITSFNYYVNSPHNLFSPDYYENFYDSASDTVYGNEWFYLILIKLISYFTKSSVIYLLICSFLSVFMMERFLCKYTKKEKMWIAFFFFTSLIFIQMLNVMRQFLAFMVFLNLLDSIVRRNIKVYILGVIALYCFHESAIALLPVYFFAHIDLFRNKIATVGLYLIFVIMTNVFISQLSSIMDLLYAVVDFKGVVKAAYLQSDEQVNNMSKGLFSTLYRLLIVIYIVKHSDKFKELYEGKGIVMFNMMFIGMLIAEIAFNRGVERLNIYFASFQFIVLGLMVYQSFFGYYKKNAEAKLLSYAIIMLSIAWLANSVLIGAAGCAPYVLNPELR